MAESEAPGGTEVLVETVALRRQRNVCDEQARMPALPAGSEFHTEGVATLKLREANVVWTRGTNSRLVLESIENM